MEINKEKIQRRIREILPEVIALRQHFHRYPELSEHEEKTAEKISSQLTKLGISHETHIAGHGVSGVIYGKNPNRGIAIRADIDALPIQENTALPFSSEISGVMHACGHDIHTAILLGTAQILQEVKDELPGSVRLLFQPSEETIGGAKQMIAAGCLRSPRIDSVIGLHVDSTVEVGKVQLMCGAMNAASCEFSVCVRGKACHGAHPSDGADPLPPACAMVSGIPAVLSRSIEPTHHALITVGQFHSGSKNNLIPSETHFSGIIRTLQTEQRTFLKSMLAEYCNGVAAAYGTSCEINFTDSYPALCNNELLFSLVQEAAAEVLGTENIVLRHTPSLGADDFSYFCQDGLRGFYYDLGVRPIGADCMEPIHSDRFAPEDTCLETGILTEVFSVLKILEKEAKTW